MAAASFKADFTIGIIESGVNSDLFIYPNPATDELVIEGIKDESANVSLTDLSGRLIYSGMIYSKGGNIKLMVSEFKSGLYLLQLTTSAERQTFKIIKQ
jgi:hypothetical protein